MVSRVLPVALAFVWAGACTSDQGARPVAPLPDASRDGASGAWQEVFTDLPGGLMSVAGTGPTDVWAVGSNEGSGRGALVLHYDGSEWERQRLGFDGDLWWAHAVEEAMLFGGTDGTVLRVVSDTVERLRTPSRVGTVFGIWGASPDDLWAVGGDTETARGAFVWRYEGERWAEVTAPAFDRAPLFFKVWGSSARDVWFVGAEGVLVHYDGTAFRRLETNLFDPLFTVHGLAGGDAIAVGGFDLGVALQRKGDATWTGLSLPAGVRQLFGVWVGADVTYAVGADATVLVQSGAGWERVDTGLATTKALHAVWQDPSGGVWAVGGDVLLPPLGAGVLVHSGTQVTTQIRDVEVRRVGLDAGRDADVPTRADTGEADAARDAAPADAGAKDARDARADSHPTPEASPDQDGRVPQVAGRIACGTGACDATTEKCCIDQSAAERPSLCMPAAATCEDGFFPVGCDQGADCASSEVCCLVRFIQFGTIAHVACQPDPESGPTCAIQMCADTDPCVAGTCMASPLISGYGQCQ